MPLRDLAGKRILIVEDDWFIAEDLRLAVLEAGGTAIGPIASVAEALAQLGAATERPDGAVLNIRVRDGESYPVADALARLGVPFLFASATEAASLPSRFGRSAILTKPVSARRVIAALAVLPAGEDPES